MTTALSVTYDDLSRLRDLMIALVDAGQIEDAAELERAHAVMQRLYTAEHFPWLDDDDDPEFDRQVEAAERDEQEGHLIPHEEVMKRLLVSENGDD